MAKAVSSLLPHGPMHQGRRAPAQIGCAARIPPAPAPRARRGISISNLNAHHGVMHTPRTERGGPGHARRGLLSISLYVHTVIA